MFNFKRVLQSISIIGFIATSGLASAAHPETPTTPPPGVNIVEAAQVQALQAKGATIVDTRKASEFGEGTIKGAISIPYDPEKSAHDVNFDGSQDKFDMSKLKDKNAEIVVFCNSGTCWKSYKSAVTLSKNGYKHVHWYRSGFPDWKGKKLPTE